MIERRASVLSVGQKRPAELAGHLPIAQFGRPFVGDDDDIGLGEAVFIEPEKFTYPSLNSVAPDRLAHFPAYGHT